MNDENDDFYREEPWRIPSVHRALLRENIKLCPFCGGEAETVEHDNGFYGCGCKDGWCNGSAVKDAYYISEDRAVAAWNKRTVKVDVTRFCEVSGL